MLSEHDEIECKFDATDVSVTAFRGYCMKELEVERFLHVVEHPDDYYKNAEGHVVRHRIDPPEQRHELTVKKRKSASSTRDRHEIDLHFAAKTGTKDVGAFLETIGFTKHMTIVKDAHIFWTQLTPSLKATFVIYDAWRADKPNDDRRFIEIEAEKGSDVTPDTAKRHINAWVKALQEQFGLGEPLNDSLWEIFSGEKYATV